MLVSKFFYLLFSSPLANFWQQLWGQPHLSNVCFFTQKLQEAPNLVMCLSPVDPLTHQATFLLFSQSVSYEICQEFCLKKHLYHSSQKVLIQLGNFKFFLLVVLYVSRALALEKDQFFQTKGLPKQLVQPNLSDGPTY